MDSLYYFFMLVVGFITVSLAIMALVAGAAVLVAYGPALLLIIAGWNLGGLFGGIAWVLALLWGMVGTALLQQYVDS